ncbi:MAG: hypothetical protein ACMG6H_17270 [Acidobacteriota bacterium]
MNDIQQFIHRLFGAAFKLVLAVAAAVFLLSLLVAALVVVLAVTLWSLLTGRRPAPARVFGQFRQASERYTGRSWPGGRSAGPRAGGADDIVDVPVREVKDGKDNNSARPGNSGPQSGSDPMARVLH